MYHQLDIFILFSTFILPFLFLYYKKNVCNSKKMCISKTKPSIQYLGHSGMIIKYKNITFLIDPWFDSAFLNSWFPYPYNKFLKQEVLKMKIDYIWLSHAHEDHFSIDFLKYIDKNTTVFIADFIGNNLFNRLEELILV